MRPTSSRNWHGLVLLVALMAGQGVWAQGEMWLTHPDGNARFSRQPGNLRWGPSPPSRTPIEVDAGKKFQTMDGFGYTLTGGSANLLMRMSSTARASLLKELFSTEGIGIGVSYLRLSIGASDLDERVFSYNDLAPGQTDPEMRKFDLAPDRAALIPVLKEILKIAPDMAIMASPWSPPVWMKTNGKSMGGSLKPEWHAAYALYLVKYIQAMRSEGITIRAFTLQNEPLNTGNNPSLLMEAPQQGRFIKKNLGPALRQAKLDTKILVYDHNCDRPDYPLAILDDPEAKKFVDGSAFHLYGGKIEAMSKVHDAHPDRNIYFTEQWVGAPGDLRGDLGWHTRELTIGATRNWSRTVLEWNLAADPNLQPHTPGGCDKCLGAITLNGDQVTRNPAYYVIAHAAKFVRPGSVRIASNLAPSLPNVAFLAPNGDRVLIVLNDGRGESQFQIRDQGKSLNTKLPAGAVGTFVWR